MIPSELPVLQDLDEPERRRLLAAAKPRRFRRREVVFHEGDPGDCLHLILAGRVAVRVTTPMGDVATLSLLGPGDAFGELALLDPDARRSATVEALEQTDTIALFRTDLFELRERHPAIDRFLTRTLASYVRRLSSMVLDALYLPVDKRIARRLADLADLYADGAATADIQLTQDDVAGIAGTTRATANRVLRALEARGVLTLNRGRITVHDPRALR